MEIRPFWEASICSSFDLSNPPRLRPLRNGAPEILGKRKEWHARRAHFDFLGYGDNGLRIAQEDHSA